MPEPVWRALADAAADEGVSVNAVLTALTSEIRRLVRSGLLHSRKPSQPA